MRTYGRQPMVWVGLVTEVIRTILARIYVIYLTAQVVASIAAGDLTAATNYTIASLAVNLLATAIGFISDLPAAKVENKVYRQLSVDFHAALTSKDMEFYRNHQSGYLTGLFRQHLDGVLELVRLIRLDISRTAVSVIAPAVVLLLVQWQLGLITITLVLLQILYMKWASGRTRQYRRLAHEIYRKYTGEVADQITNIVAFKASGRLHADHDKITALATQETDTFWLRRRKFALLDLPRNLITTLAVAASVLTVIHIAGDNPSIVAVATMTFMYLFQLSRMIGELPNIIMRYDDTMSKIEPTLEYLSTVHQDIQDPANPVPLRITRGQIVLDHVSFAYDTKDDRQVTVFTDLSLTIKPGEHLGVVGASGAGKSTLVSLLMRFDDVTAGSIAIDGIDIRNVRQDELRGQIAYVPQEPLLLHRTIRENILFSTDIQDDKQMIAAAKTAYIHDFIQTLPKGYDTIVGERGVKLSGGQKQRVVIARAILKNAPITIFDEATSALDSVSEAAIQQAMPRVMGKRTAIVVAHRLSTVAGLDRIIVMEKGGIIEQGTHDELLALKGAYFALWQRQSRFQDE